MLQVIDNDPEPGGSAPISCNICEKDFKSIRDHRKHECNFPCDTCGTSFSNLKSLIKHLADDENKNVILCNPCIEYCGYRRYKNNVCDGCIDVNSMNTKLNLPLVNYEMPHPKYLCDGCKNPFVKICYLNNIVKNFEGEYQANLKLANQFLMKKLLSGQAIQLRFMGEMLKGFRGMQQQDKKTEAGEVKNANNFKYMPVNSVSSEGEGGSDNNQAQGNAKGYNTQTGTLPDLSKGAVMMVYHEDVICMKSVAIAVVGLFVTAVLGYMLYGVLFGPHLGDDIGGN